MTLTIVPGLKVGHAVDREARTGCTVVLPPPGTVASAEVRGEAPGTRELALLDPTAHVSHVDAILLTGGSAHGLAAADGVMAWLRERGRGYRTPWGPVPIVPAAVVFDLYTGRPAWPGPELGYAACRNADHGPVPQGAVGAGIGTTVGKWAGFEFAVPGGVGSAAAAEGELVVGALAVVNPVGDVVDEDGTILAGARDGEGWLAERFPRRWRRPLPPGTNTVLLVVATNARLSKLEAYRLARRAHAGIVRAVRPAHTTHDGDVAFALATGEVEAPFEGIAALVVEVAAAAIRNAVRPG